MFACFLKMKAENSSFSGSIYSPDFKSPFLQAAGGDEL
jgi:hypothetical protein